MRHLITAFRFLGVCIILANPALGQEDYQIQRESMVEKQMIQRGIYHAPTLRAMRKVPRHLFVPEAIRNHAYFDQPLSIGYRQTISQPFIVAYMTAALRPKRAFKVLEIGTGSGYQAAILAEIVDSVFTIEIVEELGQAARQRFEQLGYGNIQTRIGDGYLGWPEKAPFDAIIVTAAPDTIPAPLLEQLKTGGRMIVPVGPPHDVQELQLIKKKRNRLKTMHLFPVRFVPFLRNN